MNIWLKFVILYLIPIVSFAFSVGAYLYLYGKSLTLEQTIINFTFLAVVLGFIASSVLTINLITHFMPNYIYLGVIFSVIAWLLDLIVVGLCLVGFYGIGRP